ncbi:hypothetical protein KHP62_09420 [Rhodobacteraceae bacterium NNCM2]|nr:hypothetical protein [Coraliihabitans acroporae]
MRSMIAIAAAFIVGACNSTPEPGVSTSVVAPAGFDQAVHDGMTCPELAEERLWISSVLYKDETAQSVGGGRAASVLTYDESMLELTDNDVAQLKGYLLSIDSSMLRKHCNLS